MGDPRLQRDVRRTRSPWWRPVGIGLALGLAPAVAWAAPADPEEAPPVETDGEASSEAPTDEGVEEDGADAGPASDDAEATGQDGEGASEMAPAGGESAEGESAEGESAGGESAGAPTSETDELRAEIAELRALIAEQREQYEVQAATLRQQQGDLSATRRKILRKEDFRAELSGYFRVRGHVFGAKWGREKPVTGGLFPEQPTAGKVMTQRLRLGTALHYKDLASVHIHVQALDDIVWGDNNDIASTALFAETPSDTNIFTGVEEPPIEVFRAWVEGRLPIGVIRAGRQSSHWGLGLLANDGDGFDDDFGENHYGNSFDRVLFGTNPVSIVQAITKKEETKEIPLTLAIAVDRLVEDPLTQYYGYQCEPGVSRDDDPDDYDDRCDVDADGITDLDHSWNADRFASDRTQRWWADGRDDVWEMVYALIYRGEDIRYLGGVGDLTAGGYVIHRVQKETESNVVVGDVYLDAKVHGVQLQFEGVGIWGRTRGLVLPAGSQAEDQLQKRAGIYGYVARLSYEQPKWKVLMESGLASGDEQVNDEVFTGRALHPDHNAGLLLYEEVLRRTTAVLWGESGRGLRSKGGVYNSHYIFPRVYGMPLDNWQIIGGFLMAWPDKADGSVIRCTERDVERLGCPAAGAEASALGWEVDFAVKHRWHEHLLFSLETGFAKATDRIPLENARLNPSGNFWTLQSRFAYEF